MKKKKYLKHLKLKCKILSLKCDIKEYKEFLDNTPIKEQDKKSIGFIKLEFTEEDGFVDEENED